MTLAFLAARFGAKPLPAIVHHNLIQLTGTVREERDIARSGASDGACMQERALDADFAWYMDYWKDRKVQACRSHTLPRFILGLYVSTTLDCSLG